MHAPTSWEDVLDCGCPACRSLAMLWARCLVVGQWLFVCDCRMWGRGFQVGDVRKLFVEPATEGPDFEFAEEAAAYVLARQPHCDAFVSSFPLKLPGASDYRWTVENMDRCRRVRTPEELSPQERQDYDNLEQQRKTLAGILAQALRGKK